MRRGLTQRTVLASIVVAVVVLGEFVVLFLAFRSLRAEERQDNQAVNVLTTSHALEESVLDIPTGLRVYLTSGHPDQLRSYQAALSKYPQQVRRLDRLTAGDPGQHARVTSINDAIAGYVRRWTAPIIRLSRSDLAAARRVSASNAAKQPVVMIRNQFVALDRQQQALSSAAPRRGGATTRRWRSGSAWQAWPLRCSARRVGGGPAPGGRPPGEAAGRCGGPAARGRPLGPGARARHSRAR